MPDPASCSTIEEVQSTQAANDAVDKLNTLTNRKRKRGEYGLYDAEQRAKIAKLAIDIGQKTRCRHMGYSFRLAARVLFYAPSHRQDSTYHDLCYTSRGALAGMRNRSMGPPNEGTIRR